jgi:hypothetical protein
MLPPDSLLLADLELQARQLDSALARLVAARATLGSTSASLWRGTARAGFDAAIDGLIRTVEAGIAAITSARDHTLIAARVVSARG